MSRKRVSKFHTDTFNVFGYPRIVHGDMRRLGKIIWVLFYIMFLPITCIRYTAILLGAVVKDLLTENDLGEDGGEFEFMMKLGYYVICGLLWPFVYLYAVLPAAIIYRIYAYFKMIAQINRFKTNYVGE